MWLYIALDMNVTVYK